MLFLSHQKNLITSLPGLGICLMLLISCGGSDTSSSSTTPSPAAPGTTVQVSVSATDPDKDQLHYKWRATEGQVNNIDSPSTTWTVPPGKGTQIIYVLVSDSRGGYTESRVPILSDIPAAIGPPVTVSATPTLGKHTLWGEVFCSTPNCNTVSRSILLPKIRVRLKTGPTSFDTISDVKGEFFFSNLDPINYDLSYSIDGINFFSAGTVNPQFVGVATNRTKLGVSTALNSSAQVVGHASLADPSVSSPFDRPVCGTRNHFFSTGDITGTVELLDATTLEQIATAPINAYGDYLLSLSLGDPQSVRVRATCEGATFTSNHFTLNPGTLSIPATITMPNRRPVVTGITVLHNETRIERPDFPRPTTLLPEMANSLGDDAFLSYKGIDTRLSACRYYQSIGGVENCDSATGNPLGKQLTFDDWKRLHQLAPYDNGVPELTTLYINRADLNLVRDMHAKKVAPGHIAYYTCNYPGPQDVTSPLGAPKAIGDETPQDIDLAIENARRDIGRLACVAMDYSVTPFVNGGLPFTKFFTFGPSGALQLSISLDGTREKFMPGACVACHGGGFYGGQYPPSLTGRADIGSRWAPFDMANFEFSTTQKMEKNMEKVNEVMKQLNHLMIAQDVDEITSQRTKDLINGWYEGGRLTQNPFFVPPLWNHDDNTRSLYRQVFQPSCQTCHTNQGVDENIVLKELLCGGAARGLARSHVMPNGLVPFERFWRSPSQPNTPNQPNLVGCPNNTPNKHPVF